MSKPVTHNAFLTIRLPETELEALRTVAEAEGFQPTVFARALLIKQLRLLCSEQIGHEMRSGVTSGEPANSTPLVKQGGSHG